MVVNIVEGYLKLRELKMKTNTIYQGDALIKLKELPNESINCVMTSPPYWALRDYGVDGQLGLEPTFDEYISKLCDIFDEVKRILRKDGTCWVNIGDTYYGSGSGTQYEPSVENSKEVYVAPYNSMKIKQRKKGAPHQSKCLVMIPQRFAIEMVNRGWILRNTIIWHKPNCMPSSVKDRFTVDFEYVFFFVKSKKYWFDGDSVREPYGEDQRMAGIRRAREYGYKGKGSYQDWYNNQRDGKDWVNKKESKDYLTFGQAKKNSKTSPPNLIHLLGKNKRTTWSICPKPFSEAHFAVYPEELCETPIKAGCPEGGIVLDPFFGAGTTGLVAVKQNKKFIGIELNPEYIEIAKRRLRPYLEQTNLNSYHKATSTPTQNEQYRELFG